MAALRLQWWCCKMVLLQVFTKDTYARSYVLTMFEDYTESFDIDKHHIELNMWGVLGLSYYDNVGLWPTLIQTLCSSASTLAHQKH